MKDDMISRQAAIKSIQECADAAHDNYEWDVEEGYLNSIDCIEALPPAQPVAKDINVSVKDCISRQAAINICDDAIDLWNGQLGTGALVAVRDVIMALPSTQPEIIHCKDCKYNPNPPECGNAACVLFYGMTDQMGFCHHGERRERE